MATFGNSSSRLSADNLRVNDDLAPGWVAGTARLPELGELVRCTDGMAQVTRILGKTGDGSRLLELTLPDRPRNPFFAAASNVLVAPERAEQIIGIGSAA